METIKLTSKYFLPAKKIFQAIYAVLVRFLNFNWVYTYFLVFWM